MVSFFKEISTAAVFGIIIVTAGIRAFFWEHPPQVIASPSDGFLYYLLAQVKLLPPVIFPLLYQLIIIIQALRLNYALNDVRLFQKTAFTTALAYVLLTALLPAWNNITPALLVNSILIWLVYRTLKLYNTQTPKTLIFNIGLITGSTVLCYFAASPLVLVSFFALGVFRPFRLNEWLILLLGILTPMYFLAGWLYLNDNLQLVLHQLEVFNPHGISPVNIWVTVITFGIMGVAIAAGVFFWQSNSGRQVIQVRKSWSILFVLLLLLAPVIFIIDNTWPDALLLALVPAAAFVSNSFLYPRKNIFPAILFWVFVALVIYNNWFVTKI